MSRAAVIGVAVVLSAAAGIASGIRAAPGTPPGPPPVSADSGHPAPGAPRARAAAATPVPAGVTLGPLDEPSAVAMAPGGAILVAEAGASRVAVFDRGGRLLRRWGRAGDGPGELRRPRGIAAAPDGRVYIADSGHHRILVFSAAGSFEKSWGRFGEAPGEFHEPLGIDVDARRVYVADARNNRVQVFDREGRFLLYVWSYGIREGQLDRPVDVAADGDGAFYVSDQGNSRIQKFDADGKFLASWGGWGPYPGLLAEPGGLAVREGRLLVADTHNHRVQVFGAPGAALGVWDDEALGGAASAARAPGAPRAARAQSEGSAGRAPEPIDLAPLPSGDGIVFCDAGADACRIVMGGPAAPHGSSARSMTSTARAAALSGSTLVVAAGSAGFLALDVAGTQPVVLGVFGGYGRDALQFVRPAGAALDLQGDAVLVSDGGNYRLAWFDLKRAAEGPLRYEAARTRFVRSIFFGDEEALVFGPIKWTLAPALLEPGPIARDARGLTYILDTLYGRIVVLDAGFRPVRSWGAHGEGAADFLDPVDLALAPSGEMLYVLDAASGRIRAFDREGRALFAWGRLGAGREGFSRPTSLAVAPDGTVLVADRAGRIRRFSARGAPLGGWGRAGAERGALDHPERVLAGASGRAFVLDAGGRRLQAFSASGALLWDLDVIEAALEARRARTAAIAAATAGGRTAPPAVPATAALTGLEASACPRRIASNAGGYTVCWGASIEPFPHNAPFSLDVSVYDAARPAAPAEMVALTVDAAMPEHGHGLVQQPVVRAIGPSIPKEKLPDHALVHGAAVGNGRFEVQEMRLHMPGRWEIYFDIGRGAVIERAQVEIPLD